MSRIHPAWYGVVVLGIVAVIAVILVARGPSTAKPAPAAELTAAPAQNTKAELAARREHMAITQKSMARAADAPAAAAAPANPGEQAAASAPAAAPAPRAARTTSAAVATPAPKPAAPKPVPHKQLDALDKMGDDLAGQLK